MPVRSKGLCAAGETVKGSLGYVILQHEDVKTITQTTPARLGEGLSLRNNCVMTKKWALIRGFPDAARGQSRQPRTRTSAL